MNNPQKRFKQKKNVITLLSMQENNENLTGKQPKGINLAPVEDYKALRPPHVEPHIKSSPRVTEPKRYQHERSRQRDVKKGSANHIYVGS